VGSMTTSGLPTGYAVRSTVLPASTECRSHQYTPYPATSSPATT
jgi:hypothetical protein